MCTFKDQQNVLVCDVAIGQVRASLTAAFGEAIQYTPMEGQGTLVQAPPSVAGEPFLALTRAAIDQAQQCQERKATGQESAAAEITHSEA
ncbi:MAG TPA: hypothetical protein VKT82_18220 [Ktedonobacterales bacterium]|nr:hypothetical protein [Ktedonobacterales bacterium]